MNSASPLISRATRHERGEVPKACRHAYRVLWLCYARSLLRRSGLDGTGEVLVLLTGHAANLLQAGEIRLCFRWFPNLQKCHPLVLKIIEAYERYKNPANEAEQT